MSTQQEKAAGEEEPSLWSRAVPMGKLLVSSQEPTGRVSTTKPTMER